jgi:hypothetical protein
MTVKTRQLMWAGCVMYLAAWVLPVIKDGVTLSEYSLFGLSKGTPGGLMDNAA